MRYFIAAALLVCVLLAGTACSGLPSGASNTPAPPAPTSVAPSADAPTGPDSPQPAKPTAKATTPASSAAATKAPQPAKTAAPSGSGERPILFAKGGDVWKLERQTKKASLLLQDARHFSWSPDGQKVLFVRGHGTTTEVWVANADGSEQRQLTKNDREDIMPSWSPDGKTIAYSSSTVALNAQIPWLWRGWGTSVDSDSVDAWTQVSEVWLVNSDGSNARKLAQGFGVAWAPDGKRLAFHRRDGEGAASVLIINSEGKNEWKAATSTNMEGQVSGGLFYGQPAWTADDQNLLYGTASYAMLSDWGLLKQVPTFSKGAVSIVGQTNGYFARIVPSADGKYLAADYYGGGGRGPTDGLAIFNLTQPSDTNFYNDVVQTTASRVLVTPQAHSPTWSPDSRYAAYVAGGSVWQWDSATQEVTRLVDGAEVDAGLSWGE